MQCFLNLYPLVLMRPILNPQFVPQTNNNYYSLGPWELVAHIILHYTGAARA